MEELSIQIHQEESGCFDERINFSHHGYEGVKKIIVTHDENVINSMEVHYYKRNGEIECTKKIGGNGHISNEFILKDGEYLTEMKGFYFLDALSNISFITNQNNIFGPYGNEGPSPFHLKGGKIVGFYGSTIGQNYIYISAIGSYIALPPIGSIMCTGTWPSTQMEFYADGIPFDHRSHESIKTISIHCSYERICSLDVQYRNNIGDLNWIKTSEKEWNIDIEKIVFDDDEYLTGVVGVYKCNIKSLTFFSNKGNTFGPFGKKFMLPYFQSFQVKGGKIVGFHGIQGSSKLKSIGFHIAPVEFPDASSIQMFTKPLLNMIPSPFVKSLVVEEEKYIEC